MAGVDLLRAALALAFVLGLIALITWLARRLRLGGTLGLAARERRLALIDVAAIDPRHKVVLVRRDDVEHLLLLGPSSALQLETRPAAVPAGEPPPKAGDAP